MNFSTRIKTKKKSPEKLPVNPKFVLNVSIDIPLKTRYAITSRLDSSQYFHSPNRLKRKYQVSITPVKLKGRSESLGPSNKLCIQKHRKLASMSYNNPTKNKIKAQKFKQLKSIDLLSKTVDKPSKVHKLGHFQRCEKVIRNISVLQCLQRDENDNMIRYTNNSNPTNITQQANERQQHLKLISSSSQLELLNVKQIRQYESLASSRRQHLNLDYIRNIQMQASAKKIQRFWRKYRTKKLIQSYSYDFIKNKKNLLQSIGVTTNKNQPSKSAFWKKNKEALLVNRNAQLVHNQIESVKRNPNKQQFDQNLGKISPMSELLIGDTFKVQQIESEQELAQSSSKERTRDISTRLHQFQAEQQGRQRFQKYLQKIKAQKKSLASSDQSQNSEIQYLFQSNPHRLAALIQQQTQQYAAKQTQQNQKHVFQTTTEQRMQKIQLFQEAINKIDNQISQISNSSTSLSPEQNRIIQTLENQRMQKALDWFGQKMQLSFSKQRGEDQDQQLVDFNKEDFSIQNKVQNASKRRQQFTHQMDKIVRLKQIKLQSDRNQHRNRDNKNVEQKRQGSEQFNPFAPINPFTHEFMNTRKDLINKRRRQDIEFKDLNTLLSKDGLQQEKGQSIRILDHSQQRQSKKTLGQMLQKLSIMQQLELCKSLGQELIMEGILDLYCMPQIINKLKQAKNKPQKTERSIQQQGLNKQQNTDRQQLHQRPQGICTNLQSIKEYLENLVSFILQNNQQTIVQNINTQTGPTAQVLFKYLRKLDVQQLSLSQSVIPLSLFQKHWGVASEQIYFDKKFQDQKMENDRIRYLKSLTKVYFRSIFDGFNQSLEYSRVFGFMGRPYPWKKVPKFEKRVGEVKEIMRSAYRRISKVSTIYCGLHFSDKKHGIPLQVMHDVQQERMNNLLQYQLADEQLKWSFYDDQEAETMYELYLLVEQQLLDEVITEVSYFCGLGS